MNFTQGLDTKTDPYQLPVGKFADLTNSVFSTTGRLTKRNGFPRLTKLPNSDQTTLTTLNDNLIATGSNLYSYNSETDDWNNKGTIQPVDLNVISAIRNSTSQSAPDMAITTDGLACLVFQDSAGGAYYQIIDTNTSEVLKSRTLLANTTSSNSRVFLLDKYFVITYTATISAGSHLQYIAIPVNNPTTARNAADITTSLTTLDAGYDGIIFGTTLYISWSDTGSDIKIAFLNSALTLSSPVVTNGYDANLISVTNDTSAIYVTFYDDGSQDAYTMSFSPILQPILTPTKVIDTEDVAEITSISSNDEILIFYEINNDYGSPYPNTVKTDYIKTVTIDADGTVGSPSVLLRSVGLASKPFIHNDVAYVIATYGETNQPTYFLIDSLGNTYMHFAYSNGGGYQGTQVLPTITAVDSTFYVPYMIKDFLASVNKNTGLASGEPVNAIYTQTGINIATFSINTTGQQSSEIAQALHLTGGQLWEYDSVKPVEHGFHVWPENIDFAVSSVGSISKQIYYYVFTYEWTDNKGMLQRSAPSIPLKADLTSASDTLSNITLYVPTLRITYKTDPNPVRIVGYRWSTAQQTYYQVTSITSPVLNDTTVDYVTFDDVKSDAEILGNTILYTTGGVVENIMAPPCSDSALYKNRMVLIDAENRNLLWYSKQVIEGVPVEFSDLFTIYVAPTSGAQGSTGVVTALSAMDDKLIIFKANAIYYITGSGPNNAGTENDFSEPVFITGSVGTTNPDSIVLTPTGLMFQSDKGIWLLRRDLGTEYIGADVESYNTLPIQSAHVIPGTTQVRFILADSKTTLMFDYFYKQWGLFTNLQAISATLNNGLHTYLSTSGIVYREELGTYLDGTKPVLMSFTTPWMNIAGLQGFERFYFANLLGTYKTPFKLAFKLQYDYNPSVTQTVIVTPEGNITPVYGDEAVWGSGGPWGGSEGDVFTARVFPEQQKCQVFRISIQEIYDPSYGIAAGAGLTLSGLNLIVGVKRGFRTQSAKRSFG